MKRIVVTNGLCAEEPCNRDRSCCRPYSRFLTPAVLRILSGYITTEAYHPEQGDMLLITIIP